MLLAHCTDEETEAREGVSSLSKETASEWLSWSLDPGLSDAKGTQPQLFSRYIHSTSSVGNLLSCLYSLCYFSKLGSLFLCSHIYKI